MCKQVEFQNVLKKTVEAATKSSSTLKLMRILILFIMAQSRARWKGRQNFSSCQWLGHEYLISLISAQITYISVHQGAELAIAHAVINFAIRKAVLFVLILRFYFYLIA